MISTYIGDAESIILWSGIAVFLILVGGSFIIRAMAKLEEVEQKRKPVKHYEPSVYKYNIPKGEK